MADSPQTDSAVVNDPALLKFTPQAAAVLRLAMNEFAVKYDLETTLEPLSDGTFMLGMKRRKHSDDWWPKNFGVSLG